MHPRVRKVIHTIIPRIPRLILEWIWIVFFWWKGFRNGCTIRFRNSRIECRKKSAIFILGKQQKEYALVLLDNFEHFFNQVKAEFQDGLRTVDISQPRWHILTSTNVSFLFPSLPEDYEREYTLRYQPRPGDCVFDIGAYVGVTTYFFSQMVAPSGTVYAFEPDPESFRCLRENITSLRMKNVYPVQKGLWSHRDSLAFHQDAGLGSAFETFTIRPFGAVCDVETLSLAEACEELHVAAPHFVKMDIEGAEIQVIEGARQFIQKNDIHFAIASYHIVDGRPTSETLEKIFAECGYAVETVHFPNRPKEFANRITYASKNHESR